MCVCVYVCVLGQDEKRMYCSCGSILRVEKDNFQKETKTCIELMKPLCRYRRILQALMTPFFFRWALKHNHYPLEGLCQTRLNWGEHGLPHCPQLLNSSKVEFDSKVCWELRHTGQPSKKISALLEKLENLRNPFCTSRVLKTQSGVGLVSRGMNRHAQWQSTNRRAWLWLCFPNTRGQQLRSVHKRGWTSKPA